MKRKILSASLCLIAAIVWGSAFYAQELASYHSSEIDAFFFGGIRFLLGGVALIPLCFIFEKEKEIPRELKAKKHKNTLIYGIITGAVLCCASALQQFGIQATQQSGKAGFITGLYLVLVPIASFLLFRQRVSPLVWIAVVFSFSGLYFLCLNGGAFSLQVGDILVFCGAIFFTAHIIVIDRFIGRVSTLRYCVVQFITVGILNLIIGACAGCNITWDGFVAVLGPIAYCGFMSTGVAYTCQIIGQKFTPPAVASLLFATEGLFSVVFESLLERTLPSATMLLGCALMLVGIVLSQLPCDIVQVLFKKRARVSDTTDTSNQNDID